MTRDYEVFELGEVTLQSGVTLPDARLAYKTYGSLDASGDNVIVMPTFYTGTHARNEGYLRAVPALDPSRWFVVSVNMFGNGLSSSPSNTAPPFDGPRFPPVTLHDNVACQHRLLTEALGVKRIALVVGWSMAGLSVVSVGGAVPGDGRRDPALLRLGPHLCAQQGLSRRREGGAHGRRRIRGR